MQSPFDFDFDKAEKEIKKKIDEKSKKEEEQKFQIFWSFDSYLVDAVCQPKIEFGKIPALVTNKIKPGCYCCKNNIQSKINTCRQCKFHNNKNRQSNFILNEDVTQMRGPNIRRIWQQVFS